MPPENRTAHGPAHGLPPRMLVRSLAVPEAWITFLVAGAAAIYVSVTVFGATREEALMAASSASSEGNLVRLASIGLLGLAGLAACINGIRPVGALVWAWIPYLVFGLMSVMWSEHPTVAFRRWGGLAILGFAAISIGAHRRRDDLLLLRAMVSFGVLCSIGLAVRVLREPGKVISAFLGSDEFNGEGLGLHAGEPIAIALLSGILLMQHKEMTKHRRAVLIGWLVVAFGLLWLLKVRFLFLLLLLVAGIFLLRPLATNLKVAGGFAVAVLVVALGATIGFAEVLTASPARVVTQGQELSYLASFSNRVPIWQTVFPDAVANPLLGAGFGSYWAGDRIEQVSRSTGFIAVHSHNGYLDEWLATGAIGLLLVSFALLRSYRLARRERGRPAARLMAGLVTIFLLLNVFDSILQQYLDMLFLALLLTASYLASSVHHGRQSDL